MRARIVSAVVCAIVVSVALAGCSAAAAHTAAAHTGAASANRAPSASATPQTVTATGTGSTAGSATGHAPTTVTVPTPTGTHGVEVTVTCPGTQAFIVTNASTSTNRHGTCGQKGTVLVPTATTGTASSAPSVSLEVLAFTGGKAFTVSAVATSTQFHQDPALVRLCASYSTAYSTLYDADLGYQKHVVTSAKWQAARSTGAGQLQTIAQTPGTPAWAAAAVTAIRTASLTATPGTAASADSADTQLVAIRCDDNSSSVAIDVTVPGEG